MHRRKFLGVGACVLTASLPGCTGSDDEDGPSIVGETLTLTTTTSTYDTGLLGELNGAFEDRYGVEVEAVAQGTGAALETARNGDSDVVIVHARPLEDEFLRNGYGVNRRALMFNDFVIVGPPDDPAGIGDLDAATAAFAAIADSESIFISRGDNSGTHAKERTIWDEATIQPGDSWYREAGTGMGEVLNQAEQSHGYTLSDRGSFIAQRSGLDLKIQLEGPITGGPELLANPYGIFAVNPGVHDHVNYDLAMSYIGFLTSTRGQDLIGGFTIDGEQLFFPERVAETPNFQQYVPENWAPTAGERQP